MAISGDGRSFAGWRGRGRGRGRGLYDALRPQARFGQASQAAEIAYGDWYFVAATTSTAATLSATFGSISLSSDADFPISASLTQSFGGIGFSSSVSISANEVSASFTGVLSSISLDANGQIALEADLSASLDSIGLASSLSVPVIASANVGFGGLDGSINVSIPVSAVAEETFGALELFAEASQPSSGVVLNASLEMSSMSMVGGCYAEHEFVYQASRFTHQKRFEKIERWFETEPEVKKLIIKAANDDGYRKAVSKYLAQLSELSIAKKDRDIAKKLFEKAVEDEIEQREAESAFASFVLFVM